MLATGGCSDGNWLKLKIIKIANFLTVLSDHVYDDYYIGGHVHLCLFNSTGEVLGMPRKPHFPHSGFSFRKLVTLRISPMYMHSHYCQPYSRLFLSHFYIISLKVPLLHSCVVLRATVFNQGVLQDYGFATLHCMVGSSMDT